MRYHSYENDFGLQENDHHLHENETAAWRAYFHMKVFALRVILKVEMHKKPQKWLIHSIDTSNALQLLNCKIISSQMHLW